MAYSVYQPGITNNSIRKTAIGNESAVKPSQLRQLQLKQCKPQFNGQFTSMTQTTNVNRNPVFKPRLKKMPVYTRKLYLNPLVYPKSGLNPKSTSIRRTNQQRSIDNNGKLKTNKQSFWLAIIGSPKTVSISSPDVSIPGMNRILDKQYGLVGRILWSLALLTCLALCVYQIHLHAAAFFAYPVAVDASVIQVSSINFPAVTICPFEPFLYNKEINDYRRMYAQLKNMTYKPINFQNIQYWQVKQDIDIFDLLELDEINVTILWELARIGKHNIQSGIILCQFHSKKNCHLSLIPEEIATFVGTCLKLSLSDNLVFDGTYNGMEVYLHGYHNEYTEWRFMIMLHVIYETPNHLVYFEPGKLLYPGFETTVTFNTKQYNRSNLPNRPCTHPKVTRRCRNKCIEDAIIANCTCRLPYIQSTNLPLCSTPQEAKHTYRRTHQVYDQLMDLCGHCSRKCWEKYFSVSQDVVKEMKNKSLTQFKVLMQDNMVEVVTEQQVHTFGVLLSEIGGSLGLFLGVCFLTLLQLVEFLVFEVVHKIQSLMH